MPYLVATTQVVTGYKKVINKATMGYMQKICHTEKNMPISKIHKQKIHVTQRNSTNVNKHPFVIGPNLITECDLTP